MKTIKEWLETLPDGYRERALKNLNPHHGNRTEPSVGAAVYGAFIWCDSPEGHYFWETVAQELYTSHDLPPIPDKSEADELLSVAQAALEYIDALPKDLVLPTMPGFDREWADQVIERAKAK